MSLRFVNFKIVNICKGYNAKFVPYVLQLKALMSSYSISGAFSAFILNFSAFWCFLVP